LYPSKIARLHLHAKTKAHFTLGVKANSNQAFLLMQNLKSAPKGYKLGVEAEIEKTFSISAKLVINAEFHGLLLVTKAEKRIPSNLRSQFATLGANVQVFINILHQCSCIYY
jgi:hypothetical protein